MSKDFTGEAYFESMVVKFELKDRIKVVWQRWSVATFVSKLENIKKFNSRRSKCHRDRCNADSE